MTETRSPMQEALLTSEAAWRWWQAGYERGIETGYERGAQDIVDDLKRAGRELAEWMPAVRREIDVRTAREKRGTAA